MISKLNGQRQFDTVLVTGGAGYVGAVLVPKLLAAGYRVKVVDLFIYGEDVLSKVASHPYLEQVKGDIRDNQLMLSALSGVDAVIHLACISNDPSFELDPQLGKSINYDCFRPLVVAAREQGVKRFVYASSSSVYGVKQEPDVTEALPVEPLTDYSRFKVQCEEILAEYESPSFTTVTLRPATVCGYSPRTRLDLTVNIFTNQAINNNRLRVFGGSQFRPNVHIDDVTDLYVHLLELPAEKVSGKTWNFGSENQSVRAIAEQVREIVGKEGLPLDVESTDDLRSYRISSERIRQDLGVVARRTVGDAIYDLKVAFEAGQIPRALEDDRYYNVRRMQNVSMR